MKCRGNRVSGYKGYLAVCMVVGSAFGTQGEAMQHGLSWKRQPHIVSRFMEGIMLKTPLPEYPRPQLVRKDWMNLNGEWDFLPNGPLPPQLPEEFPERALVPSATDAPSSCMAEPWVRGWYRRTVKLPLQWKGKKVLLHFEAVGGITTVFLGGNKVGGNTGSHNRFWIETGELDVGREYELLVYFDDREPRIPRGKMDRLAGIWQTVWMEPVPAEFIRSFRLTPDIDAGHLLIEPDAFCHGSSCSIVATAWTDGKKVASAEADAGGPIVLGIPEAKLWSPDDPFLYDLTLELKKDGLVVDHISSYFGMRKIEAGEVDGVPRFLLNNKPCLQVGLLDQTFWPESWITPPSDEALRWEVEQAKAMGFNVLRKHFKVEAARWYYWCDKLGMLVWQDLPPQPYFRHRAHETEEDKDFQRHAMAQMVNQLYNHPSIITWVIFNEAFGQFDARDMTIRARRLDGSRLIDTCSHVWPNKLNRTRYSGDLYDYHCYSRVIRLGDDYNAHIPSALGEFGGIAYRIDGHIDKAGRYFGYGDDATSADDLLNHYEDLVRQACVLRDTHNLSAIIYTEITDWKGELNGFITCDRNVVKVDPERLKKINNLFLDPSPAAPIPMPEVRVTPMPVTRGRYVRLELPGDYHLIAVTEIEVFENGENRALNRPASASSVMADYAADRAVDGVANEGSLAMTGVETSPWMEIDLERETAIGRILIHNRDGNIGKRLDHVVLKILDEDRNEVAVMKPVHAAKVIQYGGDNK